MRSAMFLIFAIMSFVWLVSMVIGMGTAEGDSLVRDMTLVDQFNRLFESLNL